MNLFSELYQYRELLKTNIKKDIRGRYKGSFLGVLWTFLNPLLQVFVYYIVFPYLMRGAAIPNYLVYLITGLIPWTYFLTGVSSGTTAIKANAGIIKKVYFPRIILLISQVCSAWVNFMISCIIILLFCGFTGAGFSIHILAVPILSVLEGLLILGIIEILSAINVYVQDVEYIVQFVLNMLFYGTPVIYSLDQFPPTHILYKLIANNPVTILINGYRDAFLYHTWPDWTALLVVFVFSILLIIFGYFIFKKLEFRFAEEL